MKAAFIEKVGPASSIIYGELPKPEPIGSQVLVKVGAVSVNPIDTYVRAGVVAMPLTMPFIPGCDLAGTVEAVGPEAKVFQVGDRVWGSNQGLLGRQGTFAEYAAVDEAWLYPAPTGGQKIEDEQLAATALVGITAHLGLVREARLQRDEILFVNGGTGGVGSMVVQMAKALGAKVVTTCGSEDKVQLAYQLGADLAINYKTQNVTAEVLKFAPDGVHVFWEVLREPNFDMAVEILAERGRMILMAGRDSRPPFPVGPFYLKGCSVHGFVMFKATPDEQRVAAGDINRWLASGQLTARIDRVLPLSEAAQAHALQESATVEKHKSLAGKIVLKP